MQKFIVWGLLLTNNNLLIKEKNQNFNFSVIMAIYNTENYLKESIESIIKQNIDFKENIELILVDDGSTDNSKEICLEYQKKFPNNITYIYQEHEGQAKARNRGLKIASGKYINFFDSDDKFSLSTFGNVFEFFEKYYNETDIVTIPIELFDRINGPHNLNYKFKSTGIVNLLEYPEFILINAPPSFIKRDAIDIDFNTDLIISEDSLFVNEILLKRKTLGILNEATYFYRKRQDSSSLIDTSKTNKKYYNHRLVNYLFKLIELSKDENNNIPKYIQYALMYELQFYFIESNLDILSKKEKNEFYNYLSNILSFIDDEIILKQRKLSEKLKKIVLLFKYQKLEFKTSNLNNFSCLAGNNILETLNNNILYIDSIDIKSDKLEILGYFDSFFKSEDYEIIALKSNNGLNNQSPDKNQNVNNVYKAEKVEYPFRDQIYLGKTFPKFNFKLNIPFSKKEEFSVKIKLNYKNNLLNIALEFKNYCKLSEKSFYSLRDQKILTYESRIFYVENYNLSKLFKLELSNFKTIIFLIPHNIKNKKLFISLFNISILRLAWFISKILKNDREIWLFQDRGDIADDCGEVLYEYALKQDDGVKKYYVLSNKSNDYARVKKEYKNIINYHSIKHKYLYLISSKIISSHPDEGIINPFNPRSYQFIAGLLNIKKYFLQHGIIKDDISYWLHRYDKNLELVVTSTRLEYESLFNYHYNFENGVVNLLGLPRYDKLDTRKNKKQILFMPSWRRNIKTREDFLNSTFNESLSLLLNDEDLMIFLKNKGYKFLFKPHPNVLKFLDDLEINDYVEIVKDMRYRDLFNESAILITDYSSVAFDFSYLKKPVLYYQIYNDYHFDLETSYFNYETMGLGDVLKTEKELRDSIKTYVENGCIMENKYKQRVDDFFEFNDKNNSKRVYDWIKKH